MKSKLQVQLEKAVIPFWKTMIDYQNGGFFNSLNNDLYLNKKEDKSIIFHARYLYTFSLWYKELKDKKLLKYINHAYDFIENHFLDNIHGGYYWAVSYQGQPTVKTKHLYAQNFVVYALAEYAQATDNKKAAIKAYELYNFMRLKAKSNNFYYHEQFSNNWLPTLNELLSNNPEKYPYTTNTILHQLEAWTNLYRVCPTEQLKGDIIKLLGAYKTVFYNKENKNFHVYINKNYKIDNYDVSYGHDIETCWLINEALEVLKIEDNELSEILLDVADQVLTKAMTTKGLIYGIEKGRVIESRVWWVQLEAMVGFMDAYEKTGKIKYFDAVKEIYDYCQAHLVDERENSEWFWGKDKAGNLLNYKIVEPWKAPYHIGRAYIQLIKRSNYDSSRLQQT